MSKTEIEENHFNEGPILLVVVVFDEGNFKFLYFLKALGKLGDDEESGEVHDF